jgi:hypothetical protein
VSGLRLEGREPFLSAAAALLRESGCVVRRWRTSTTGVAYTQAEDWGICAPQPRGPASFGVFAHEVGHQMLHREGTRPRWEEEVEAAQYALDQFPRFGLPGADEYARSTVPGLAWAFEKSLRRAGDRAAMATRMRHRVDGTPWAVCVDLAELRLAEAR